MAYPQITVDIFNRARDAKKGAEEARGLSRKMMVALSEEFSGEDAESFGVSLVHSEDGQSARISSPFGEARAKSSVFLTDGGLHTRCSFERKLVDTLDRDIWREVFVLEVREDGRIFSEFFNEETALFNVLRPRRDQYFTLAIVITAALGRNPSDQ